MGAALLLAAARANEDDMSLRVCDYDKDMQVEFSECDAYNQ